MEIIADNFINILFLCFSLLSLSKNLYLFPLFIGEKDHVPTGAKAQAGQRIKCEIIFFVTQWAVQCWQHK
ncbi:hypothetical protein NF212_17455 [Parasalinivibrio latis]